MHGQKSIKLFPKYVLLRHVLEELALDQVPLRNYSVCTCLS